MASHSPIRTAQTFAVDPELAVQALYRDLVLPDTELVLFFCSAFFDRQRLAAAIQRRFAGIRVIGCTTAGEIGPQGFSEHSLTAVAFSSTAFTAVCGLLPGLRDFSADTVHAFAQRQLQALEAALLLEASPGNSFGLLLIDGLSVREEPVIGVLQRELDNIPLIGGSAGDGLQFSATYVYFDGAFHSDSAVLLLLNTDLPFKIFKTQHFLPTEERMVVTAADTRQRIVKEINGRPAAVEYARLVGVDVDDLHPMRFAASPVVVVIGDTYYVRSIQRANPDNSLTFYCAIEEGLVLRVARGVDLLENLRHAFEDVRAQIGQPQLTLACDCILRRLEVFQNGLNGPVGEVLRENRVVGFNTYGEQFLGVHVNQTFAAVAIAHDRHDA